MIGKSRATSVSTLATVFGMATLAVSHAEPRVQREIVDHGNLSGPPIMAIVAVKDQRISLYDSSGNVMRARVSSGATGYETPPGTYSILQKNKEHYSNLYDDAAMPFMQRITWSGVALHEGVLPGYPASHGCVRMPNSFASQIFPLTKIGMRVIIARDDVAPVDIVHRVLMKPAPVTSNAVVSRTAYDTDEGEEQGPRPFLADLRNWPERQAEMDALLAKASEKAAEAELLKDPIDELKAEVAAKTKRHAAAVKNLRAIEKGKRSADDKVASADRDLAYAKDPARLVPWETALAKAEAAVLTATSRLDKAEDDAQALANERQRAKADRTIRAAERALKDASSQAARAQRDLATAKLPERYKKQDMALAKAAKDAETAAQKLAVAESAVQSAEAELKVATQQLTEATSAMTAAASAATDARRKTLPVSIFVSRKTQRIYLRQGHEPVADYPIAITEPDKPVGTHVFTAVDYGPNANSLRWTAVSLARRAVREVAEVSDNSRRQRDDAGLPFQTDASVAASVLDRLTIPPEILQKVSGSVWPGSSLIVSDEPMHKETSNATDFIVVMSGEPQGGLKRRPKPAPARSMYFEDAWASNSNYNIMYDRYGRKIRIQKKPLFSWW